MDEPFSGNSDVDQNGSGYSVDGRRASLDIVFFIETFTSRGVDGVNDTSFSLVRVTIGFHLAIDDHEVADG